ncbi:MAG: Mrp/NBP35 family ATP-binding protein [Candidatus Mcinerneyibacterium aminivorans]|uniref:Iron-sulfur cluster carrier protein n=1 Tax=Candidatus Mcinerneyibacterium aminivorans TaxID=2703815 RepID=A0A5D0MDH0_9BACT|nr:MAG: Mrp/NBP35 family ATP-binding protein [Candidatus Mcinerneyibacterium aminivorans]
MSNKKINHNQEKEKKEKMQKENLERIKKKIIVMSGKGGVGKSTVATNLVYGLALEGKTVGILDVDIHGPSIGKLMGIEGKKLGKPKSDNRPTPVRVVENVYAVTIASFLENPDTPLVWRGPLKTGAIKQFLQDIEWPELDYLIVDCPPGTGDEPLTISQILGGMDGSIIVTTPQDIALLDARKTINFSRKMNVEVLGIVENMSGFKCPHCGEEINLFKTGGGSKAAKDFEVDLLGNIPVDKDIVDATDSGRPYIYDNSNNEGAKIYKDITRKIINKMGV